MEKKKLAVLFPGVGYTCAKPLLYYAARMAQEAGYEVIRLNYGSDIHNFPGRSPEELFPIIELAERRAEKQLAAVNWEQYEDILFISKSIGTTVACYEEEIQERRARHFMMTPLPSTLLALEDVEGSFVIGTADPYTEEELIRKVAAAYPDKVGALYEGCDHSLEKKGDLAGNLRRLEEVMELLKKQFR